MLLPCEEEGKETCQLLLLDLHQGLSLGRHRHPEGGEMEGGATAKVGALKAIGDGPEVIGWMLTRGKSKLDPPVLTRAPLVQVVLGLWESSRSRANPNLSVDGVDGKLTIKSKYVLLIHLGLHI